MLQRHKKVPLHPERGHRYFPDRKQGKEHIKEADSSRNPGEDLLKDLQRRLLPKLP